MAGLPLHKHMVPQLLAIIILALSFVATPLPARSAQPIMRIDYPDFWPFFTRTADGNMTGFFYEIVSEALLQMHIGTAWETFPWGRCQANVQEGLADAMVTVPTTKRLRYTVTHRDPFYLKKLTIFTYKDHPRLVFIQNIKTIDDIKRYGFTVITYVGNGWNDKHIVSRKIQTHQTAKVKNVWPMLAHKRGDIVIEWPHAAWPDIKKTGAAKDIVQTSISIDAMPFHLLVNKKSPFASRMDEFNRTIQRMKASGRIGKIVNKYMGRKRP